MKNEISLKVSEQVKCPFCPDKLIDHSKKDITRHFHKVLNAAMGAQKLCEELYAANGRLNEDYEAHKRIKGDISVEDLDAEKKRMREEYEKLKQEQIQKQKIEDDNQKTTLESPKEHNCQPGDDCQHE